MEPRAEARNERQRTVERAVEVDGDELRPPRVSSSAFQQPSEEAEKRNESQANEKDADGEKTAEDDGVNGNAADGTGEATEAADTKGEYGSSSEVAGGRPPLPVFECTNPCGISPRERTEAQDEASLSEAVKEETEDGGPAPTLSPVPRNCAPGGDAAALPRREESGRRKEEAEVAEGAAGAGSSVDAGSADEGETGMAAGERLETPLESGEPAKLCGILDLLCEEGIVGRTETELCKQKMFQLDVALQAALTKERAAVSQMACLKRDVEDQRSELERLLRESREHEMEMKRLQGKLKDKEAELESSADAEKLLKLQIRELKKEKKSLEDALVGRREEIRQAFGVLTENAAAEIECAKAAALQVEGVKRELEIAAQDPERFRIQAEQFNQVMQVMQSQSASVAQELEALEQKSAGANEKLQALEAKKEEAMLQVTVKRDEVTAAELAERAVMGKTEAAKMAYLQGVESKRAAEIQLKAHSTELKRILDLTSRTRSRFDRAKVDFKKAVSTRDAICAQLPELKSVKFDGEMEGKKLGKGTSSPLVRGRYVFNLMQADRLKEKKRLEIEIDRARETVAAPPRGYESACLYVTVSSRPSPAALQESDTKERSEEVEMAFRKLLELEKEASATRGDVDTWAQHVKALAAQKETLLREVAAAHQRVTETQQTLQIKLIRLECNNYVTLKQNSDQQVAEMLERYKVLSNEVGILRLQVEAKTKAIERRSLQTQKEVEQRCWLRLEQSRLIQKVKEESRLMEENVIEIDRLNNVINTIEKEMLETKRAYQTAVESRNFTGVQLIDRHAKKIK
ncbi:hypothetical protein BESB_046310 [Besnoitia besnoiti]|uniref:Uncharacterized protein n=1 Tax=Besnoitia besnoiti TaxID=94643 RepID=A0A2A9MEX9_BESBE|nr:hypothetical protein BESB_046310 [Besnoitia besnoiti]PFH36439.1 hypothetical protein BESB_046310 [Besnoitia besnoiti]